MKNKFRIWLNIVTICFCIAAIAVGVYAATNASVTASGKIGFTAHNSKITAGGYIYGHAAGNVDNGLPTDINSKDTFTPVTADGTATSVSAELAIGDRYFSDMASTDGTPAPIVIVIEVTNDSNYDITVSTNLDKVTMPANVSITLKNAATAASQTISHNAKAIFEFTLTLNPSATGTSGLSYKTFELTAFSIPIMSVKYVQQESQGYSVTVNYVYCITFGVKTIGCTINGTEI
jgi:hypothetical protein